MSNISSIEIEKFNADQKQAYYRILVYGESGVGKTVFASTWPELLFLDSDHGLASVRTTVDYIRIENWRDLQFAYHFLENEDHQYQTIILDSLNAVQDLAMEHTIGQYRGIKRPYHGGLPARSDYGKVLFDFHNLIAAFCRLEHVNLVFTAHASTRQFETDYVEPQFMGRATAKKIAKKMDIVGYMNRREVEIEGKRQIIPVMNFNETMHVSKDRTWSLPSSIVSPTYEKLKRYWSQ